MGWGANLTSGNTSRLGEQIALATAAARSNDFPRSFAKYIFFYKFSGHREKSGSIFVSLQNKPSLMEGSCRSTPRVMNL